MSTSNTVARPHVDIATDNRHFDASDVVILAPENYRHHVSGVFQRYSDNASVQFVPTQFQR